MNVEGFMNVYKSSSSDSGGGGGATLVVTVCSHNQD